MFADMVGFTAKVASDEIAGRRDRDAFIGTVRKRHEQLGGLLVKTLGDGTLSMFPSVLEAVQAGVAIQRESRASNIDVRIGIHAGEVILEDGDLFGDTVNIASRVESFAEPGSVLLSDAARELIANRSDIVTISLGEFRLKNVGRPFELFAVSDPAIFVPVTASIEAKGERYSVLSVTLPSHGSPILGRDEDLSALERYVEESRIVTITGSGGVGKTKVATELAWRLASEYQDGVAFVPMADVTRTEDFLPTLAAVLDVKEAEQRSSFDGIVSLIGSGTVLLVLDNLEQLMESAGDIARLIEKCPSLKIVATSRAPLRLSAEREFPLSPLAVPDEPETEDPIELLANPSVALFVERARLVTPDFELTQPNARAVVGICRRLDGLPLALELAAPRLRLLSPEALLERLGHALDVLGTGPLDVHKRQQTLRATIAWSHNLLSSEEQRLFRRLSVFFGGFTLADIEQVCGEDGEDVVTQVEALVDKALVRVQGSTGRFSMLQTIVEFSVEQLTAAGEAERFAMRHALHYAALARTIREGVEGSTQIASIQRGMLEERNLETALDTLLVAARSGDRVACELGLMVCGDLLMYWHIRGKNISAHVSTSAFLATDREARATEGRSGALVTAGLAQWMLGLHEESLATWTEAHAFAELAGADRVLCIAEFCVALANLSLGDAEARSWSQRSAEHAHTLGFAFIEGFALTISAMACAMSGDLETAIMEFNVALRIQRDLGDEEGAGMSLSGLASISARRSDFELALDLYGDSLAAFEACGDRGEEARVLSEMAWTALEAGDVDLARSRFLDAVQAHTDVASVRGVGMALNGLAACEVAEGRIERAAVLAAAAESFVSQEGIAVVYTADSPGQAAIDQAWASLSPEDASRARARAQRLSVVDALVLARSGI